MGKKRTISPEHLAKLQAARDEYLKKKKAAQEEPSAGSFEVHGTTETPETVEDIASDSDIDELKAQMKEMMETNALLKAAILGNRPVEKETVHVSGNRLINEVEKYLVDPANYPDPTPRLRKEPRLQPLAFDYNYELDYKVDVSSYETKTGINMKEPKFTVQLNRIVLNDQGEQTDKRYIARRLIFHEDPQAAVVIARENGLPVDQSNERDFLNEMRYYRVRDWLFGIFWPKPAVQNQGVREEVIGGQLVQVFTKSSEDASSIDFDKINLKMV